MKRKEFLKKGIASGAIIGSYGFAPDLIPDDYGQIKSAGR
jgi:hypothetical protein